MAEHALVVLDHLGSGQEGRTAEEVARDLRGRLSRAGWAERADVIVIEPELESWVWSSSPHVEQVLGWEGRQPGLRNWLTERGLWPDGVAKPLDPAASLRQALRKVSLPHSAALFGKLAGTVSLERCEDRSFQRLKTTLRSWFRAEGT